MEEVEDAKQAYLDELAVGSLINSIKQAPAMMAEARLKESEAESRLKEAKKLADELKAQILFLNGDKIAAGKNTEARKDTANVILAKDATYKEAMKTITMAESALVKARLELSTVHDRFSAQRNEARLVTGILNYLA